MPLTGMEITAYRKKPISRYFRPRSGMSAHFGITKVRRNTLRPSFHRYSEIGPMGQSQPQNAFLKRNEESRKQETRIIAAGWMSGKTPVSRKAFRFISPAMGSQPSTPAGR